MTSMDDSLGLDSGQRDIIVMYDGPVLETHGASQCAGSNCCIHNPSEHPLRDAPMHWIRELNLMMRICPHGHPHPDPDSMQFLQLFYFDGWHPCCSNRCCGVEDDNDAWQPAPREC